MRLIDIIRRSGRSLRTAKGRTILTALAIAVGGFTLTLTLAASNGARAYAKRLIDSNFDKSELVVAKDQTLFSNSGGSTMPQQYDETVTSFSGGGGGNFQLQFKRLTANDIEQIRKTEGVERVREAYQVNIQYVTRGEGAKRYTGSVQAYNAAQRPELEAGQLPKGDDLTGQNILLPNVYIGVLGFDSPQSAIGKTITLAVRRPFSQAGVSAALAQLQSGQPVSVAANDLFETTTATYTISGVTKKPATSLNFGLESMQISTAEAKRLNEYTTINTPDYQKFTLVNVRVKDGTDKTKLQSVKQRLEQQGYAVRSVEDAQKTLTQIVTILQSIVTVFGAITLVAAVFGVINTQYISVLERTREIGLMKALGMRNRDVGRLFMIEATWIGFLGGLIGIIVAFLLSVPLNPFITKKLELGAGNHLLIFNPLQTVLLLAGLMLIATIAGYLPARKAAHLDPIEALRTE